MKISDKAAANFSFLESWAATVKRSLRDDPNSYEPANLTKLCDAVEGGVFTRASVGEKRDDRGRRLLQLETPAPGSSVIVKRYMLPAHAATTRALELSKGRIVLILGSGGAIHKAYFDLALRGMRTNLHRILFGLTSTGRCWEKSKSKDQHRHIVPTAYNLGRGSSREIVLETLKDREKRLLIDLFAISDIWHWDELAGRRRIGDAGDGRRYGLEDLSFDHSLDRGRK